MAKILSLAAREILDSRGTPTVEVTLHAEKGSVSASVPSGASVGAHEALELRDGDMSRYAGHGVLKAVANINGEIAGSVVGKDFDQGSLDDTLKRLDGTANKSNFGANALLGVSLAFARAQALEQGVPLYRSIAALVGRSEVAMPQPFFNVLNGGKHANSGLDIQEYMLVPTAFGTIAEKIQAAAGCIVELKTLLQEKGYDTGLGDEGGFAPHLHSNEEALDLLLAAITKAGYTSTQVGIALDIAATSFYAAGTYTLRAGGEEHSFDNIGMLAWYGKLVEQYPIISIEDPFAEDDMDGFVALRAQMRGSVSIVGDDLTVTNATRIAEASKHGAIDAVIIKPNQVGTISETLEAAAAARNAGVRLFASHRSGETDDTSISDIAVGLSCEYFKSGSLAREERVCKYNRLMEIATELSIPTHN